MNPIDTPLLQRWALGMAQHIAQLSKDPSTKVGAVIFDRKRRIISAGYNGLPRGVEDTPARLDDRALKYKMILHAERNALSFATAPTEGSTMVVTHACCAQCAASIIQAGVACVLHPKPTNDLRTRWAGDLELAAMMFAEAGVIVREIEPFV